MEYPHAIRTIAPASASATPAAAPPPGAGCSDPRRLDEFPNRAFGDVLYVCKLSPYPACRPAQHRGDRGPDAIPSRTPFRSLTRQADHLT